MLTVRNLNLNFKYLSCQDTQKETPEVIPIEDTPYMKYLTIILLNLGE